MRNYEAIYSTPLRQLHDCAGVEWRLAVTFSALQINCEKPISISQIGGMKMRTTKSTSFLPLPIVLTGGPLGLPAASAEEILKAWHRVTPTFTAKQAS